MVQASFAERIRRIEGNQNLTFEDRVLVGLTDDSAGRLSKSGFRKLKSGLVKLGRFVAGFVLLFATVTIYRHKESVLDWLGSLDFVTPYEAFVPSVLTLLAGGVMIFFAIKLKRAAKRAVTEPARLPFAIGMVLGLAISLDPSDSVMAGLTQLVSSI